MDRPPAVVKTPPAGLPIAVASEPSWLALGAEPTAARAARQFTHKYLGEDPLLGDAIIVVAELVGNAITHRPEDYVAPPGISSFIHLSLQLWRRWLLVTVVDPWPGIPVLRLAGETDEGGRGLTVVDALVASWWTDVRPHDKTVCAVLVRPGHTITPVELKSLRS